MKLFKYLLPLLVALGFSSSAVFADCREGQEHSRFSDELNQRDWDALKEYINTKRTINLAEKSSNLTIAGDIRAEWRHLNEKRLHKNVRGGNHYDTCVGNMNAAEVTAFDARQRSGSSSSSEAGVLPLESGSSNEPDSSGENVITSETNKSSSLSERCGLPISRNDFDVEFNLYFDYVCDRAWGVAWLQFDNSAGVADNKLACDVDPAGYHGSGSECGLNLKKAYMGYNICCEGDTRFDVEVGRRPLYTIFDSQVQFLSRFDGILLKYDSNWECFADWYVHAGGFVVDERVNHFAWIVEAGLLNIYDMGFDFKYSFIDWKKNGKNRCWVNNPRGFKFENSQFTAAYHFDPEFLCMPAKLYGAFIWNHAAKRTRFADDESSRSQTVPPVVLAADDESSSSSSSSESRDSSSYRHRGKRKNIAWYVGFRVGDVVCEGDWAVDVQYQVVEANSIPDNDVGGIGRGNVLGESYTVAGRGNTNYRGWRVQGLYALTNDLTLDTRIEWSQQDYKRIGGQHSYSKFELEAIYAF